MKSNCMCPNKGIGWNDPDCPIHCQPSEEKDQYGHKIIRPTIPDDTFDELEYDRIAKELKETTATPKQEEWEEKIYDLLSTTEPLGKGFKIIKTDAGTANEIIDLICQLLKEEREKVIEEVKKNTKDLTKYETEFTCPCGQEHSVQFLIRKPKVMKGKITEITINSEQLKK